MTPKSRLLSILISVGQDDMGSGRDVGNSFENATSITPKSGTGYLGSGIYSLRVNIGIGLQRALDTTLTITTGGDAEWFGQTTVWYYDGDAAQSGFITDDQETWMQTEVMGPGVVTFWWKVSSEEGCDFLTFYIGKKRKGEISGKVDWVQESFEVPSGSQILKWVYTKDEEGTKGADAGWVDNLSFTPS